MQHWSKSFITSIGKLESGRKKYMRALCTYVLWEKKSGHDDNQLQPLLGFSPEGKIVNVCQSHILTNQMRINIV